MSENDTSRLVTDKPPVVLPAGCRRGFPRQRRLVSQKCFSEAFDSSDGFPTGTLVLWLRKADDASGRVGVVASKRTFRRAVDRNRAKRLLREAFRLQCQNLACEFDVVLLARKRILSAKRQAVEHDFVVALKRARALSADTAAGIRQ